MLITAIVLRVNPQSLLVRNDATGEEILVNFHNTDGFNVGDRVVIFYTGTMTMSVPPQITPIAIRVIGRAPVRPTPPIVVVPPLFPPVFPPVETVPPTREMRGIVAQPGTEFLIVQNAVTNRQVRVEYAHARHFCRGQDIAVIYDPHVNNNPNRIVAEDIIPVC